MKFKGYEEDRLVFHKYFKAFDKGPQSGWQFSAVVKSPDQVPRLTPSCPPT